MCIVRVVQLIINLKDELYIISVYFENMVSKINKFKINKNK